MKIASFLENYDMILFDMDGVITSEHNYWITAALTVYESIFECHSGNIEKWQKNGEKIKDIVFHHDLTISKLKNLGVNTNWDIAYIVVMVAKKLKFKSKISDDVLFEKVYECIEKIDVQAPRLYEMVAKRFSDTYGYDYSYAKREGELWKSIQMYFQEWYMGDAVYTSVYGKPPHKIRGKTGLIYEEKPLIKLSKLHIVLNTMKSSGKILGVGTGRPRVEVNEPMLSFDIKKYFSEDHIITYSDVLAAQKNLLEQNISVDLSKPHPFMFLKGALSKNYDDKKIIDGDYDKEMLKRVLVVGDAGSDIIAAKKAGMAFAAVLTGITGEYGREYFEKMSADYILSSISDFVVED